MREIAYLLRSKLGLVREEPPGSRLCALLRKDDSFEALHPRGERGLFIDKPTLMAEAKHFEGGEKSAFAESLAKGEQFLGSASNADKKAAVAAKRGVQGALHKELMKDAGWQSMLEVWTSTDDPEEGDYSKMYSREAVKQMVHEWAVSSTKSDDSALMQYVARETFDLQGAQTAHFIHERDMALQKVYENWTEDGNPPGMTEQQVKDRIITGYKSFLNAMYQHTQRELKDAGIKELYLVRGAGYERPVSEPIYESITMQPMSSFSIDASTAHAFGAYRKNGVLMVMRVPAERIIGSAKTGFGCLSEREFVMLGSKNVRGVVIPVEAVSEKASESKTFSRKKYESAVADLVKSYWERAAQAAPNKSDWIDALKRKPVNIDADEENADWMKFGSWDLPPYKSDEFMRVIYGKLEEFKKLPIYKWAVEHGWIKGDEWTGTYDPGTAKDDDGDEKPGKMLASLLRKKGGHEDQPRVPAGSDEGGQWTSESGGIGTTGQQQRRKAAEQRVRRKAKQRHLSDKERKALESYKASDRATQDLGKKGEKLVVDTTKGEWVGKLKPFDLFADIAGMHTAFEVKTMTPKNSNVKFTMHPPSRARKYAHMKQNKIEARAARQIAVDARTSDIKMYVFMGYHNSNGQHTINGKPGHVYLGSPRLYLTKNGKVTDKLNPAFKQFKTLGELKRLLKS